EGRVNGLQELSRNMMLPDSSCTLALQFQQPAGIVAKNQGFILHTERQIANGCNSARQIPNGGVGSHCP
ncbi:MAG: hypothetical protein KDE19_09065, partial [Caldilineaceae bacterium]|nr:hypothetical protein [Caldilineaceae bacterium]